MLVKGMCIFNLGNVARQFQKGFFPFTLPLTPYESFYFSVSSPTRGIFNCFKKSTISSGCVMTYHGILICISLITNNVELFLIYLFAIPIFSYVKFLLKYSTLYFSSFCFCLYLSSSLKIFIYSGYK